MTWTAIEFDPNLLRELKTRAAREGTTLGRLVNALLRAATAKARLTSYRFHLTTVGGEGLLPGVRLNDRRTLFDHIDGR